MGQGILLEAVDTFQEADQAGRGQKPHQECDTSVLRVVPLDPCSSEQSLTTMDHLGPVISQCVLAVLAMYNVRTMLVGYGHPRT